jgi:hypothetical protein
VGGGDGRRGGDRWSIASIVEISNEPLVWEWSRVFSPEALRAEGCSGTTAIRRWEERRLDIDVLNEFHTDGDGRSSTTEGEVAVAAFEAVDKVAAAAFLLVR